MSKKCLSKINNTNAELYCLVGKMGKLFYFVLIQLLREVVFFLKKIVVKVIGTPVFNTLEPSPLQG
jgi:hypothetical protein